MGYGVIVLLIVTLRVTTCADWTQLVGSYYDYEPVAALSGESGSVFVAGDMQHNMGGHANLNSQDVFILKYSYSGILEWLQVVGGSGSDRVLQLVSGGTGFVFIVGETTGILDDTWQPKTGSATTSVDVFIAKVSTSDGVVVWTRQIGTGVKDVVSSALAGDSGSVVVAGYTQGSVGGECTSGSVWDTYNIGCQQNAGMWDSFALECTPTGDLKWLRLIGGSGNESTFDLVPGGAGSVLLVGRTSGNLDGQTSSGGTDIFIAKLNSFDGEVVWTRQIGSGAESAIGATLAGDSGSIYIAGHTEVMGGQRDAFVLKYSLSGDLEWPQFIGGSHDDYVSALISGGSGTVLLIGKTSRHLTQSGGSIGIFITKLSGVSGDIIWSESVTEGETDSVAGALAATSASSLVAGSTRRGNWAGAQDTIILKHSASGEIEWSRQRLLGQDGSHDESTCCVAFGSSGLAFIVGKKSFTVGTDLPRLFVLQVRLSDGNTAWVKELDPRAQDSVAGAVADDSGSIIVAGDVSARLVGSTMAGSFNAFVVKYSASNILDWSWFSDYSTTRPAYSLISGDGGSVYLVGTAPQNTVSSKVSLDIFMTKIATSNGAVLWQKQIGNSFASRVVSAISGGGGSILIAGDSHADVKGKPNQGLNDAFILKFSGSGELEWPAVIGGAGNESSFRLVPLGSSSVFLVGQTESRLDPDAKQSGGMDVFVSKLDSSTGHIMWIRQFGSGAPGIAAGALVGDGGSLFVAGQTQVMMMGGSGQALYDTFVFKCSASGDLEWLQLVGGSKRDSAYELVSGGIESVFLVGRTGSVQDLGLDTFVTKLDGWTGDEIFSRTISAGASNSIIGATSGPRGSLFIAGNTQGNVQDSTGFSSIRSNPSVQDAFVFRYSSSGNKEWLEFATDNATGAFPYGLVADRLAVAGDGSMFLVGNTASGLDSELDDTDVFITHFTPIVATTTRTSSTSTEFTSTTTSSITGTETTTRTTATISSTTTTPTTISFTTSSITSVTTSVTSSTATATTATATTTTSRTTFTSTSTQTRTTSITNTSTTTVTTGIALDSDNGWRSQSTLALIASTIGALAFFQN